MKLNWSIRGIVRIQLQQCPVLDRGHRRPHAQAWRPGTNLVSATIVQGPCTRTMSSAVIVLECLNTQLYRPEYSAVVVW